MFLCKTLRKNSKTLSYNVLVFVILDNEKKKIIIIKIKIKNNNCTI